MSFDNKELLRGGPCQSPWIEVNSNHEEMNLTAMKNIRCGNKNDVGSEVVEGKEYENNMGKIRAGRREKST